VSPINYDRPWHSGIRCLSVMSVGCQITDGYRLCTKSRSPMRRLHCDQASMAERNSACTVCLSDMVHIKPKTSETYGHAGHWKQKYRVPQTHYTPVLDSGQCCTPPIRRLYSIYCGPGGLGHALQVGLSTDCGLLHQPLASSVTPNEGRKEGLLKQMLCFYCSY